MSKTYIAVRDQYEGFHWWADAPEEVAFLRHRHRHMFKWEVTIEVNHDNRELEFFMVKDKVKKLILPFTTMMDNLGSCEQQAERILKGLLNLYGDNRLYTVEVSEDGENSGIVTHEPNTNNDSLFSRTTGIREDDFGEEDGPPLRHIPHRDIRRRLGRVREPVPSRASRDWKTHRERAALAGSFDCEEDPERYR